MEKKQNVPALRFQGFSGEWKRQKFGEVATFINGRAYAQSELLSAGKYKVLRVGNFYTNSTWYYSNLELSDKYYANRGDLLYTWSATFGPHIWDGDKVIYHYHIWKIEVKEQLEKLFFLQLLERDKKNLLNDTNGSTMVHITKLGMENKTDFIPNNIDEQSKIGQFCSQINCKIEKEKRKIQKLQQFRQAMLTKLFPREGAAEPELRFRGFSGKWRICTLAKCAALHARIGWQNLRKSEFLAKGDYYLITGTDFVDGQIEWRTCHYVSKLRYDQDKNIQVQNGDILVTKDGTLGKVAYVDGADKPATLNAGVFNVKINVNDVDAKYLYQYLKGPYLMDYVNQRATGGTIKHLNQNILVDFPVVMPSFEEQKIIGDFFYRLDRYISLQQKKLERMQRLKAALLEKLFV